LDLTCFWPGCEVPASYCEIDHLRPHAHGGATAPANAGPACRRHNGWKGDRWYAGRKRWGWAITRPDGSTFSGAPPSPPTP
jgi:5-methylcytosine-specific restriction endonuclease McrA